MAFSWIERDAFLRNADRQVFDLAIVGGGITGAGIARDAAMRGLSVALVDKGDFASGTSGRSSRLIHGGLRYIKEGEFALVRESVEERETLGRIAPHLARPLPFLLPVYAGMRPGRLALSIGLVLYEALGKFRSPGRARALGPAGVLALEPRLAREGLTGGVLYYDRATDDARLTLETLIAAARAGAKIANHVEATRVLRETTRVAGIEVRDRLAGTGFAQIRARFTILAVGPWLDRVLAREGVASPPRLRRTRGSHLVLAPGRLVLRHAVGFPSITDRRPVFMIPWGEFTYVGTTDLDHEGSEDDVAANTSEIDYLLATVNRIVTGGPFGRSDVASTWSALRPLVRGDAENSASATSREDAVFDLESGLVAIAGGKLTTYRRMAARAVDHVLARLPDRTGAYPTARTDRIPLPGAPAWKDRGSRLESDAWETLTRGHELPADVANHLLDTYGVRGLDVADLASRNRDARARIHPGRPDLWAEVEFAVGDEMVMTLEDFLLRRTDLFHKTPDHARGVARKVASRIGALLGWDSARVDRELERHDALCRRHEAFLRLDRARPAESPRVRR